MKPDITFLLENANWPALLVDAASTILRSNQAAVKLFRDAMYAALKDKLPHDVWDYPTP